ncbi:MAG: bifunctional UDP-N-acetylglucosamine diphosphorylase/glucosamine-1-phosphate N-acetyltransferase GlmU [Chloroflexota bacterium]
MTRPVAVVLAGGLGTRMKSDTPKLLHPLCGRPMLAYVLDAARAATGSDPVVVYSPATAALRDAFPAGVAFALQERPDGTGDALRAGLAAVPADADEVVVLSGDVPLVEESLVAGVLGRRRDIGATAALVSFETWEPGVLGRVIRTADGERVTRIVEARDATPDELTVGEVNAGVYAFDAAWLRPAIARLTPSRATGELYLTQLVDLAVADGGTVVAFEAPDDGTLDGINDRVQLAQATLILRERINTAWMRAGVTMLDPATAYVDAEVELTADVTLEPNVILRGRSRVGEGTRIGAGSQLIDSVVGPHCRVWASVLECSTVEEGATIGPFSHLRPGSSIGPGAELGNFAEVKNSRLEAGVKQHHMSYLGDAHVGEGTNVGAGTITANYDGVSKHHTEIGKGVFLGVDTMLRAPITLGDGARTGAGAVVTRDVPPGKLAVGVPARLRDPRPPPSPAGPAAAIGAVAADAAGEPPAVDPSPSPGGAG